MPHAWQTDLNEIYLDNIYFFIASVIYLQENYGFNSDEIEEKNLSKYSYVFSTYFDLVNRLKSYYDRNLDLTTRLIDKKQNNSKKH